MIKHIKCDIFKSGAKIICHQVNCQGVMGGGVAKQVKDRYPSVFKVYKSLCDTTSPESLIGYTSFVTTNENIIANLFAQNDFGCDGNCYTNYDALYKCLNQVKSFTEENYKGETVAIPYLMSCYRGGGHWNVVYKMIEEIFGDSDIEVLICEYNGG